MTEPVAIVEFDPTEGGVYCGAKTRASEKHAHCRRPAGWGTDHGPKGRRGKRRPGSGRCKLHGGATPITTGRGTALSRLRYRGVERVELRELIEQFEDDPDPLNIMPELAAARAALVDFLNRFAMNRDALLDWHADWSLKYLPISQENELAFFGLLEEYAVLCGEHGIELSEKQESNLALAKKYVAKLTEERLSGRVKPKEVLDPSAAIGLIGEITKIAEREWERREKNAISRTDFFRLMNQMGLATEKIIRRLITDDVEATKVLTELKHDWHTLALNL